MARKNSTMTAAGARTHRWSDILAMPRTAPRGRAMIMDRAAAFRVSARPGSRYVVQALASVNGFHRDHSSWPLSSMTRQIHQRSEEHTSELQSRENLVCRL